MRVRAWLSLGLLSVSLSAAAAEAPAPAPAFGDKGVLRVLRMDARPDDPFFNLSDERPGFDRELLEGFARLYKLRLEIVTVPSWEDLVPALLGKKGDIAAGRFTVTPARAKVIAFTAVSYTHLTLPTIYSV